MLSNPSCFFNNPASRRSPLSQPSFVRRHLKAAVLCAAMAVAGITTAQAQTINAVMHAPLRALDPVISTAYILRNYGYMVYDTLLAQDASNAIQPQMASWKVSPDGKTYTCLLYTSDAADE